MKAYTYVDRGRFELRDKPRPALLDPRDALVRVTLGSICTSDLHIKHGSVPRAVRGITVGHEMVGVVEAVGKAVRAVAPGDRVAVNVETFCGECFFCRHGYVNNCTDPDGGWALGCRIDGGQAEYVRVPHADQGLTRIPDGGSALASLLSFGRIEDAVRAQDAFGRSIHAFTRSLLRELGCSIGADVPDGVQEVSGRPRLRLPWKRLGEAS